MERVGGADVGAEVVGACGGGRDEKSSRARSCPLPTSACTATSATMGRVSLGAGAGRSEPMTGTTSSTGSFGPIFRGIFL